MDYLLEEKVTPFIESVKKSLETENYYAALSLSLTLPDICSSLEFPKEKNTGKKYKFFFDKYLLSKYQSQIGPNKDVYTFLNGSDCYALRCAFLHQGADNIEKQRAREVVKKFQFIVPPKNGSIVHNNGGSVLQLQVDIFCKDIIQGVENWMKENKDNEKVSMNANKLLSIKEIGTTFFM